MSNDWISDDKPKKGKKKEVKYNHEAEQAVVGCMIGHPKEVIPKVADVLKTSDFFVPAHQILVEVICLLEENGKPVDVMTIHESLVERKLDVEVGSPGILGELLTAYPLHYNVDSYIQMVLRQSKYRNLIKMVRSLEEMTLSEEPIEEILNASQAILDDIGTIRDGEISHGKAGWEDLYTHIHANIEELQRKWIKTGFMQLDASLNGLRPGRSYVIAARPGIGKTALALNMVRNLCMNEKACGLITMEMDDTECRLRILSNHASIDTRRIENGCSDAEKAVLDGLRPEVEKWPIHVLDQSTMSLSDLRKRARQLVKMGCKAIFIDYLQLMHPDDARKKSYDSLTEITRTIKVMARRYQVPFITLVQLNRAERNGDGEPDLENLAGSDSVGRDADCVIILYKDGEGSDFRHVPITWKIAKNRQGPRGKIATNFDGPLVRFTEKGAA
jgi:replicative DNA helicase